MRRSLFGSLAREWKASGSLAWGPINELWSDLLGGRPSRSGPSVNWLTSLRVTAVLACTRKIAEGVSTVPAKLFRMPPGSRRRQPATDHPLYDLLDSGPNDWQDSLQFRDTLAVHAVLSGDGFAFTNRIRGRVVEMIPLLPGRCIPIQANDYSVGYRITAPDGSCETVSSRQVLHIRGISWNGYEGLDTIRLAREAVGLSLAGEQTHAMLHANGARPSGVLSVAKTLDEAGLVRLAAWVKKHYGGLDNTSRVMVLDNDAKFTPFDMKGVDAQHIQLRQHQIEEVCRAMGVLPMVIGHPADMAARAAVDSINALHLVHTVRPWHRRFDKAMTRQLLMPDERKEGLYVKLLDGEFLRATAKDRAEYNRIALGGPNNPGWATQNEVRGWDDMDEDDSANADKLWAPINMSPNDGAGQSTQ
ncbi:MAG: phage portal protein [Devosia sp.]|nr:phage portal protein [Devosia sp.]